MSLSSHCLPSFTTSAAPPINPICNPCTPPLTSSSFLPNLSSSPVTPPLNHPPLTNHKEDAALHLLCLAAENSPQSSPTPNRSESHSPLHLSAHPSPTTTPLMYHPQLATSPLSPVHPHTGSPQPSSPSHLSQSQKPLVDPMQSSPSLIPPSTMSIPITIPMPLQQSPHEMPPNVSPSGLPTHPSHVIPMTHLPPHYPLYSPHASAFPPPPTTQMFQPTQPIFAYPQLAYAHAAAAAAASPHLFNTLQYPPVPPSQAQVPPNGQASLSPASSTASTQPPPPQQALHAAHLHPHSSSTRSPPSGSLSLPASPLMPTSPSLSTYAPPSMPITVAPTAAPVGAAHALYAHPHAHLHPGVAVASDPAPLAPSAPTGPLGAPILVQKVKGPWRPDEDAILTQLVAKLGPRRWTVIASHITGRTGKQARERWLNQLSPDLAKRPWTAEEDRVVMQAHARLGNRWSEIAKLLKGRTDNATKNRFNTTIRRQISEMAGNGAVPRGSEVDVEDDGGVACTKIVTRQGDDEAGSVITTCESPDGTRRGKRKHDPDGHNDHERLPQRSKAMTASS